jgi:hypothetical protein
MGQISVDYITLFYFSVSFWELSLGKAPPIVLPSRTRACVPTVAPLVAISLFHQCPYF